MSDLPHPRQPLSTAKAKPLWRPMDSLRTSMVKQVFSREHFTHKKGLLFTPSVHTDEGVGFQADTSHSSSTDPDHPEDDAAHATSTSAHDAQSETRMQNQSIEEIRAQAFAEGLAQGLEEGRAQAHQAQAENEQAQLAAQSAAQTQALLQEIDQKVDALREDPAQLQEPLKRLALHLAEQLVLSDLALSPQAVEHLIERCVETLDVPDASALVVELNAQDLALLQNQPRAEGQPQAGWRLQVDHSLLPGSVRVRADDAVVSDLIENRLESLAHSLLQDPQAWQANSAFTPSKLASRLVSQRGSAHTVEDAQAKPRAMHAAAAPEPVVAAPEAAAEHEHAVEDAEFGAEDATEKHTYEAHEVMACAAPPPEGVTKNFADALSDISLELDKLDD